MGYSTFLDLLDDIRAMHALWSKGHGECAAVTGPLKNVNPNLFVT